VEKAKAVMNSPVIPDISPRFARNGTYGEWLGIYQELAGEFEPYSVYDLCSLGCRKAGQLEDLGVKVIKDIPDDFNLTSKQYHQLQATKSGERVINKDEIRHFMSTLQYPLYFLDYETFSDVIPPFDGLRPYQQVPFQYSLHVLESPGAELVHKEYLHTENSLCVRPLLEQMRQDIGDEGSVIVWYKSFETGRNAEMAAMEPEFNNFLYGINDRVVDLMTPFKEDWFIDKDFYGSASIKAVLPVLVPELTYKDLNVQGGKAAQRVWMQSVMQGIAPEKKDEVMDDLRKYCELDTLAMVKIWEVLNEYRT
jgi:hypothetical protein